MSIPIVLHIPHSSKIIPDNIQDQFVLSDEKLKLDIGWIFNKICD